jgi:hypothetical protein
MVVMAVCMAIQTMLCIAGAVAGFAAWRRSVAALAEMRSMVEQQAHELRTHLGRMSATVDETARALRHGTAAVEEVITDARDAVGNARHAVGSVASVVTARRAAVAVGVWKGIQMWRRRREAHRLERESLEEQRLASDGGAEPQET